MSHQVDRVKKRFQAEGISIAEWSRVNGFSVVMVYRVLAGSAKGTRGESHKIAVALGLKKAPRHPQFGGDIAA